jgi:hypothetical protein
MTQHITFTVREGYRVPNWKDLPVEVVESALTHGFAIATTATAVAATTPVIVQSNERDDEKIHEEYRLQIANLHKGYAQQLEAFKTMQSEKRDSVIESLTDQIVALKDQVETYKSKKVHVDKLASVIESRVEGHLREFGETLEPIKNMFGRETKKGKVAEIVVENVLRQYFTSALIEDVSASGKSGDLHMELRNHKYMFEIKNMIKIQRSHLEIFEETVRANDGLISAAIFVSTNCPIPTKGSLSIELIGDTPVAYVYMDHENMLYSTIETLHCYCELARKFRTYREEKSQKRDQIDIDLKTLLSDNMRDVSWIFAQCEPLRGTVNTLIRSISDYERKAHESINRMLLFLERYPHIKVELDSHQIQQAEVARGFTEEEINAIALSGEKVTNKSVMRILGVDEQYIHARGGLKKLKAMITAAGDDGDDNDDGGREFTEKEIDKLSLIGGRLTLAIVMKALKKSKVYIKKRGGMKELNRLVFDRKKKLKQADSGDEETSDDDEN